MKNSIVIAIIVSSIISFSCSNNRNNETETPDFQNQTPEAFEENSELVSVSKRYETDIIQKLYQEAMDKNQNLKSLNKNISEIDKIKNDSLESYYKFVHENSNYYELVNNYINSINDTALKIETKSFFDKLEAKYKNSISKHEFSNEQINSRTQVLNDQLILMKLFVTAPMMINYQKNELPNIKPLNYVIEKFDSLINDSKKYTKSVN